VNEKVETIMAENFLFPSRGDQLGQGHYWVVNEFSEGPNILDIKVLRFDADRGEWTWRKNGIMQEEYDQNPTNDKHLTFGLPLYAPADGFVKASWRNFPDNPIPGKKLPEVTGAGGVEKKIFGGGNAIAIETDGGMVFIIAHLQQGTIPTALCPFNETFPSTMERIGDYQKASFIEKSQRPRIRKGDFIGLAGNSGNSRGPHIHISVQPSISDTQRGDDQSIHFYRAWRQSNLSNAPAEPGNWSKLDGDAITSAVGNSSILPSPFLRRDTATAGAISRLALSFVSNLRLITAVSDSDSNLKLISWDLTPSNIIRRQNLLNKSGGTRH
jgi:hypothetical protein